MVGEGSEIVSRNGQGVVSNASRIWEQCQPVRDQERRGFIDCQRIDSTKFASLAWELAKEWVQTVERARRQACQPVSRIGRRVEHSVPLDAPNPALLDLMRHTSLGLVMPYRFASLEWLGSGEHRLVFGVGSNLPTDC